MSTNCRWALAATGILVLAACASTPSTELSEDDYVNAMTTICLDTTQVLDALPSPPDQISVADFATAAASALTAEAESVRRLQAPEEMADDHRAFIRNTDEQATSWTSLRSVPPTDQQALEQLVTTIGQQTLGRNDLALQMGVPACERTP